MSVTGRWPSHVAAAHAACLRWSWPVSPVTAALGVYTTGEALRGTSSSGGAAARRALLTLCPCTPFHVVLAVPVNLSEQKASRCREPSVGPAWRRKEKFCGARAPPSSSQIRSRARVSTLSSSWLSHAFYFCCVHLQVEKKKFRFLIFFYIRRITVCH